ncbi:MAG: HEAT repeat domain-containing protein [Methanolinea sp.]|nr:HEAT repeat domain-containing protein [Methanolinea sp.]
MALTDPGSTRMDHLKLGILALLVVACLFLEVYVHWYLGVRVVYTHFFYIPIVLAAVWYGKRAVMVAVLLGGAHFLGSWAFTGTPSTESAVRALVFVVIALVIGAVMDRLRRGEDVAAPGTSCDVPRSPRGGLREWKALIPLPPDVKKMREEGDVRALLRALRHKDAGIQYQAAEALGELRDPTAVEPLMNSLAGDRYAGVRWKAAEALARIGPPSVPALIRVLSHPDDDVRWMAAIALGVIADPSSLDPLISLLSEDDRFVRSRAAYAISQFGESAVDPLIRALEEGGHATRWGAAYALGKIGDLRGIDPLVRAVRDPDDEVLAEALTSLSGMGDPAIIRLLHEMEGMDASELRRAAEALSELPDRSTRESVHRLLDRTLPETRAAIISAMRGGGRRKGEA